MSDGKVTEYNQVQASPTPDSNWSDTHIVSPEPSKAINPKAKESQVLFQSLEHEIEIHNPQSQQTPVLTHRNIDSSDKVLEVDRVVKTQAHKIEKRNEINEDGSDPMIIVSQV